MATICLYFQIHQPYRIKPYRVFDIGNDHDYFSYDGESRLNNRHVLSGVSSRCYVPTLELLLQLLEQHPELQFSISISGVALEQIKLYQGQVLEMLQRMAASGRVEFMAETYYHSLASVYHEDEFREQVRAHHKMIEELLGVSPSAFRNTELIYSHRIAQLARELGYHTMLTEGIDEILGGDHPNQVFKAKDLDITLLLKNYKLSDDIAFRFSNSSWPEWPLTPEKYVQWITNKDGDVINLFMDFETFGEHQKHESGIFDFLKKLPGAFLHMGHQFSKVSDVKDKHVPTKELHIPHYISWADTERDLSAWTENSMQRSAIEAGYELLPEVLKTGQSDLIHDMRRLLTSDHVYYMSTKLFGDGDVHSYFSPYESPYEAFTNYMNVLHDVKFRTTEANSR